MTIAEFLTARLNEEDAQLERIAEAEAERCRNDGMPDTTAQEVKDYWLSQGAEVDWTYQLADLAAKRAILADYEHALTNRRAHPDDLALAGTLLALFGVVKRLVSVYSDHPDYQQELKP